MIELTKAEKKQIKEVLRKGILRRHAEWQQQLSELIAKPFEENCNEFDRSMQLTDNARKFFKEAMRMEDYYGGSMMVTGLVRLCDEGYLKREDLNSLSDRVREYVVSIHESDIL